MDWQIEYIVEGDSYNNVLSECDVISQLKHYCSYSPSKASKYAKGVIKWQERTANRLQAMLENIYSNLTEPLVVVATFSNGETIYKKA